MEKVIFYVLKSDQIDERHQFVCRFIEKMRSIGNTVFIATANAEHSRELDQLLWTSPPESFMPHQIIEPSNPAIAANSDEESGLSSEQTTTTESVVICHTLESENADCVQDVYINLRPQPPSNHAKLNRLIEIVVKDNDVLNSTRANYKFYQECGYPLQSHPVQNL
ncbi:MAG: DNA polymerase III subunit chi [Cellvibrionaceae bacterium]